VFVLGAPTAGLLGRTEEEALRVGRFTPLTSRLSFSRWYALRASASLFRTLAGASSEKSSRIARFDALPFSKNNTPPVFKIALGSSTINLNDDLPPRFHKVQPIVYHNMQKKSSLDGFALIYSPTLAHFSAVRKPLSRYYMKLSKRLSHKAGALKERPFV